MSSDKVSCRKKFLPSLFATLFRGSALGAMCRHFTHPTADCPGSREGFLRRDMNWAREAVKSLTAQSKGGKQVKAADIEKLFIDLAVSSGV